MFRFVTLTSKVLSLVTCLTLIAMFFYDIPNAEEFVILWCWALIIIRLGWAAFQFFTLPQLDKIALTPEKREEVIKEFSGKITFVGGTNVTLRLVVAWVLFALLLLHHDYLLAILTLSTFFGRLILEFEVCSNIDNLRRI